MEIVQSSSSTSSNDCHALDRRGSERNQTRAKSAAARFAAVAVLMLAGMFLISPATANAATKTSTGTGTWGTNGTWSPSGVPANGDDVIIAAGHNVTVNTNTNSLATLTVNGTLTVGSNGTARTVTVTGNVSVASGGTIVCGSNNATHTMNIGGNLSNAGTFDGQVTASRVINVTFNGTANQTISGAGATTRFNTITVNNTTATNTIEVTSSNFAAAAGFLTLTRGIFKVSGSFTFTNTFFSTAAYSIPTNTGLWLNNTNATVTAQNGDPTVTGLLRISAGTYNVGTVADNDLDYATGATIDIQGGALNITGALQGAVVSTTGSTSTVTYSQSGGTVTTALLNVLSDVTQGGKTYGQFDIAAAGSSFTMSAGTIILFNPTTTQNDCVIGAATHNVTGGTFQFGSATNTVTNPYAITCSTPLFNVVIKDSASRFAELLNSGLTVKGSFTIDAGAEFTTLSQTMNVAGAWTNNGTFTPGTGTVTLNGTTGQTMSGSSTTPFHNLTITNTGGTISANSNFNIDATGTLTVNANANLSPAAAVVINSGGANGTITGSGTIQVTRTAATADYVNQYKLATNTLSSMTVDYAGGGAQTVNSTVGSYGALKTSNSGTKTLEGAVTVNGGVTIGSGTTLDASTSNFGMNVGGDWTNNGGTFTPRAGTVTFNSTSAAQAINGTATTQTFYNVTVNKTGQTLSVAGSTTTVTLNNNLTITAGTFAAGTASQINIAGTWSNSGSYTSGSGNVTFNGSVAQNISGSQATTFNGLKVGNSAGVTLTVSATTNGLLDLASADLTTGSFTLNQAGTSSGNFDVVGNSKRTDLTVGTARPFGNQFVQLTRTAGSVANINVHLVKGSLNNDFTNSVKRLYTITTTGASGLTANVQLRYIDSELNGNTEDNTLQLWRKDGSTWNIQGADGSGGHDFTNNWVKLSGVTQFSPWTIAGPAAVTDVALVSVKATRFDGRVLLEWQTGYEVNNVGFNVYREKNGNLSRVNPEPLAGSALIAGPAIQMRAGFAYSWWDNDAGDDDSARYWLEDVDLSGRTTNHGPFGIERSSPEDQPSGWGKSQSTLLSAFNRDASDPGSTAQLERKAKVVKITSENLQIQSSVASERAVKLSIQREGLYRVAQPELVAAGIPSDADPRKFQLFVDGAEIPMTVMGEADGRFDAADAVEFYGVGINSAFTANHVYWLVAGADVGLRTQHAEARSGLPAPESFLYTVERRDKMIYVPALKNGGAEKFFGPLIFNAQPADQSITLQHVAADGPDATLEVSLQGFTQSPHSVRVVFNTKDLGTITFNNLEKGSARYAIPQSMLKEGSNQVQLIGPSGFADISLADYVRLTYSHTNTADGNALRFPALAGRTVTLDGFTSSSIRVIDVTAAAVPREVDGVEVKAGKKDGEFSATFSVPGTGSRTLLALAADQMKRPASMVANQPSSWGAPSNSADYVAVTRRDMIDAIQPLIAKRRAQGLSTAVVDIEDVYDEFSFGNKSPQALKDFFSFAKTSWKQAPKFALLAGDASFDPKNYTGFGDFDLVPTKLVETAFNETATDDWFVDMNGDGVPEVAIGRLPVRTSQEMTALVSKIVGYDQSTPTNSVLLVADQNEGFDFETADTHLQTLLPNGMPTTDVRRGVVGDSAARNQLLAAINQGQKLVNFYGHGSTRLWTSAPLLTTADAASLANRDRLALFDSMTCLNGFFHDPSLESLGEALLKAQGGAIAVWASSGMTDPGAQVQMNEEAIRQLFGTGGLTIGEVTARAKAAVGNLDVRRTWILLGDPATRLR